MGFQPSMYFSEICYSCLKNDQNTGIKRFAIVSTITKNLDTIKEKGLIFLSILIF